MSRYIINISTAVSPTLRQYACEYHAVNVAAMSRLVRDAKTFFTSLISSTRGARTGLVRLAKTRHLAALRELAINLLHGNIPLSPEQKRKLRRFKAILRSIAAKAVSRAYILRNITVVIQFLVAVAPFIYSL